ncbi:MAG: hypothetical protein SCARUB_00379 [Candidatus Scalindua rubra]|uniref:Uncharacterized protein n=1 Tax=Candidatus Scalindua rubra TaxID=1872076 RepID=A0A1E3XFU2_9BACT|nr:MAG: hypothetical protein SCARUB_00379 [Candidatus Scalindua rubra]
MSGTPLNFDEIETVKLLRANGLTFHAISLKINRDPKTVKKACLDPIIASEIIEIQEVLADQYESLSRRMIDSITDDDINKLNAYQRTIASGICTDKMRLLRNESTENISMEKLDADKEAREERRIELEESMSEITGVDYEAERVKLREKILRESAR